MRTAITALIGAATTAIMISGAGIAAASTQTATATEHFHEVVASPTATKANVIVYGAFTAAGVDQENHNNTDTFKFPGGSFLVTPKYTVKSEHLNKTTCLLTQNLQITYTISHGTGTYTNISGSGHGTITDLEITARNPHGACSPGKTPLAQQVIAYGQGPVTLP